MELTEQGLVLGSFLTCLYILFIPLVIYSSLNTVLVGLFTVSKTENHKNDHMSGTVFFVSTIGSVLGVFFAAYWLLDTLANVASYAFLASISAGLSLILASSIPEFKNKPRIAIIGFALLMILLGFNLTFLQGKPGKTYSSKGGKEDWAIVSNRPSFYGNHSVVDFQNDKGIKWRGLLTNGLVNNRVYENGDSASTFTYMLEALSKSGDKPLNSALVLGLGTGIVPTRLANEGVDVDAVELDETVLKIAEHEFGFEKSNTSIFIQDARTFVRNFPNTYDVVVIDLFHGDGIPEHVVSKEFFHDVKSCIRKGGTMAMNAFYGTEDKRSKHALIKTIASEFNVIVLFEKSNIKTPMTQGYVLARNTNENWSFTIKVDEFNAQIQKRILPILQNWKSYNTKSVELDNTAIITDELNKWKLLTNDIDMAYRKKIIKSVPSEILHSSF